MIDPAGMAPFSAEAEPTVGACTWDKPVPLRWLLVDEYSGRYSEPDQVVAVCADVRGLFVDTPPSRYERYTLLACRPAGRLLTAVGQGGGSAWLGNILLESRHDPDRPPPDGCDCASTRCTCMEELLDITVLGCRPSTQGQGLVDVDLEGLVRGEPRYTDRTLAQRPDAIAFHLTSVEDDEELGECADISGLFVERPEPLMVPAVLVGCRPEPPLQVALAKLAAGRPSKAQVAASLMAIDAEGTVVAALSQSVFGVVIGVRPSVMGHGLVDVIFDSPVSEPFPAGARDIWDLWYAGRPVEPNLWADYDRALRREWAGAALAHHRGGTPDRPAGDVYHLDGRFVTDIEGFYCAIGETINGPGGYFGWNLDALYDCLTGGFGARSPFRLVWHDSEVAKRHLVPGYDRQCWAPAVTMDYLLDMFGEHSVEVELR